MKVKCKLIISRYECFIHDVILKYKFEKDWFYHSAYILKSDIYPDKEKYNEILESGIGITEEFLLKWCEYNNMNDEDIVKEIAKMTYEEIKCLCQRVIKRSRYTIAKYEPTELQDAIKKIDNMKFKIELD